MAGRVLSHDTPQSTAGVTFDLKKDAQSYDMNPRRYLNYLDHLYKLDPVQQNRAKILVMTEPEGEHIISSLGHGLIGAMFCAYNEHRHLILRPDDIWLAITTAFGLYVNKHAEEMRDHFVSFEDKKDLEVEVNGSMKTANWNHILELISGLVEKNTKTGVRDWLEPDFSTTQPVCKTVGRIAMMSALQEYFTYSIHFRCGIPKVTLQGTLEDWVKLHTKAAHLKSFNVQCLSHWADLLDLILTKFIESYQGHVDEEFWSHICTKPSWGSGPQYFGGWATVFIPFHYTSGEYILSEAVPENNKWGKIDNNHIPPAAVEVPVKIKDITGEEYDTVFYGGHLVTIYNPADDSLRPSVDWLIMDITGQEKVQDRRDWMDTRKDKASSDKFPEPVRFIYGG